MSMVLLRDGSLADLQGRGIFGGILVGVRRLGSHDAPISWHQSGRWRWDGRDHPADIVGGLPDPLPRNVVTR